MSRHIKKLGKKKKEKEEETMWENIICGWRLTLQLINHTNPLYYIFHLIFYIGSLHERLDSEFVNILEFNQSIKNELAATKFFFK